MRRAEEAATDADAASTLRAGLVALQAELDRHPFRAPRWLAGPHAQTFWSPLFRSGKPLPWSLERLAVGDGDDLRLHHLGGRGDLPTVLLLHGLEGSVRSNYVAGTAARFHARGWNVVAMEFRTCGGDINRAPRLYHSGETTDVQRVAAALCARIRSGDLGGPLYVSGVSLGGNVVAKWLGEDPGRVPAEVAAGAAVSNPFDLEVSGPAVDRALGGFYTWRFLRTLRPKALLKATQYPDRLDAGAIRRCRSFLEFDDHATARLHGFADAWDYWRRSGCGQFLESVDRPLLFVCSRDDPFNPGEAIPEAEVRRHPWLLGAFTDHGGHVGFVDGVPWRTRHWSEEQVERFFVGLETLRLGGDEARTRGRGEETDRPPRASEETELATI